MTKPIEEIGTEAEGGGKGSRKFACATDFINKLCIGKGCFFFFLAPSTLFMVEEQQFGESTRVKTFHAEGFCTNRKNL